MTGTLSINQGTVTLTSDASLICNGNLVLDGGNAFFVNEGYVEDDGTVLVEGGSRFTNDGELDTYYTATLTLSQSTFLDYGGI